MFYTIILLLLFSVALLIFDHRNRYSWFFIMMAVGSSLAFFSLVLHINMFGSYYIYTTGIWFNLDYTIYSYIVRNIRIPLGTAIRIMNAGHILFLLSVPLFFFEINRTLRKVAEHKAFGRLFNVVLFFVPAFTLAFCDPLSSTWFYILCHRQSAFYGLLKAFTALYKLLIILIVMSPVYMLIRHSHLIMMSYLKKRVLLLAGCLFLVNSAFLGFFYLGPYSISAEKVRRSGFWVFENMQTSFRHLYLWMPTITMILLSLCMVILLSFRMDFSATPFFRRKILQNINLMNETLGDMLHSQKNLLFTLQLLTRKAEGKIIGDAARGEIEKMTEIIEDSFQNTTDMLNQLRTVKYRFAPSDLTDIIRSACADIVIPEDVRLEIDYAGMGSQYGMYDKYHLQKALVNILSNSLEALALCPKTDKLIRIEISYIFRWVVVAVTDNGTGIRRKELKKLFIPHYTNKNGTLNWGLGLSYVYRVIGAHLGQIKIDTQLGGYTSVLIMLPLKERSGGLDKNRAGGRYKGNPVLSLRHHRRGTK